MKFKSSINNFFLIMKKLKFLSPLAVDDGLWGLHAPGTSELGITRSTPCREKSYIYGQTSEGICITDSRSRNRQLNTLLTFLFLS